MFSCFCVFIAWSESTMIPSHLPVTINTKGSAMADWVTMSSLATAGGTLVLAVATFASVRSANRSAKVSERAFLAANLPLIVPSQLTDPPEKVRFQDDHWVKLPGGHAYAHAT